jgi:tetratricopeptide (TPR) repeat protein/TolB-like protein
MGVVYKAWDTKLERNVALKFLPAHLAHSAEELTRFRQEARAISALNHPNIATIYDIDEVDGYSFLALEYLPGGTLRGALEHLKAAGEQLSLDQALEYAIQIADALAHAHRHGVIHRDIKAANMLFTEAGTLKITDFGLAKLVQSSAITQTASVLGTPSAMSPEQAQGLRVDERSDIFSAGVVLFQLFTGELPFRGETAASVLYQVVHAPAPPVSSLRSGTPIAIERIVTKALEKDRTVRYQAAADLAADLRAVRRELLSGSSASRSALETVATGAVPARRRHSKPLALAAGGLILVVLAAVGWPEFRDRVLTDASRLHVRSLPAQKRLAVLPFRNGGGNAAQQAFLDGLVDVVASRLTRVERAGGALVVVLSPEEVRSRNITTATDAGRKLGANLVMTGSIVEAGRKPQIIVNLEDPESMEVLRSETIDASQPDLAAEAGKLVRMLEVALTSGERERLGAGDSSNPEATRFYLEGRGYLLRNDRLENLDLAAAAFRDAVGKDVNFALAWAGLAEALWRKYTTLKDPALLAEASGHAERAVQLNGRLAAARIVKGQILREQGKYEDAAAELRAALVFEPANADALRGLGQAYESLRNYDEAEAVYRTAIEARPADAAGYTYLGIFYFNRNRLPDAERAFQSALRLTPGNPRAHSNLGAVYINMRRYNDAVAEFQKSVDLDPTVLAYANLGTAYYRLGHFADAIQPFLRAAELAPKDAARWGDLGDAYRWTTGLDDKAAAAYQHAIDLLNEEIRIDARDPRLRARLAMYYASKGERGRALEEIGKALIIDPSSAYVQFRAALVYEQAGHRDAALRALERAMKAGQPLADVLDTPVLKALRSDPRFGRIASPIP